MSLGEHDRQGDLGTLTLVTAILTSIQEAAAELGFSLVGVAPAVTSPGYSQLVQWVDAGFAGEMDYVRQRLEAYQHPEHVLAGVKTIVVLAFPYPALPELEVVPGAGRLARYLWTGDDYHDTIHHRLKVLKRRVLDRVPAAKVRGVVDTAPLMEREIAELAGLGWRAKNTLLINKTLGSYFFLACLLTDLELPLSEPHATTHCGSCRRCLEACPTAAFPQPGVLDARRCISYLTIEHRDSIPRELRPLMGDWLFGCDVCQEVCPWNRPRQLLRREAEEKQAAGDVSKESPGTGADNVVFCGDEKTSFGSLQLAALFELDEEAFRAQFRKTPLWRARRRGILRNAAIVLGNQRHVPSAAALALGLGDSEPVVRVASAWALGQIWSLGEVAGGVAGKALGERRLMETDSEVLEEIQLALDSRR